MNTVYALLNSIRNTNGLDLSVSLQDAFYTVTAHSATGHTRNAFRTDNIHILIDWLHTELRMATDE